MSHTACTLRAAVRTPCCAFFCLLRGHAQPDLLAVGALVEISEGPFSMKKGEVSKVKDGKISNVIVLLASLLACSIACSTACFACLLHGLLACSIACSMACLLAGCLLLCDFSPSRILEKCQPRISCCGGWGGPTLLIVYARKQARVPEVAEFWLYHIARLLAALLIARLPARFAYWSTRVVVFSCSP